MSEEIKMPNPPEPMDSEPVEKKSKTWLWILLAVLAVLILCGCVIAVIGVVIFAINGEIDNTMFNQIPTLLSLV